VSFATALLFYPVAISILALTFPLALVVRVLTAPFDRHRMATSRAIRALGELLVRVYPFWRVRIEGRLPPPPATFVVVPNHRSMADAIAVACLPREMKWLGKRSVFRFPWLGWSFRLAGHVPVLRGDRRSGADALARMRGYLAAGIPVGIFAEGTRAREGALEAFRAGPFALAVDAGVPVVPVAIAGAGRAMPRGRAWIRPACIRVRILDPVPTAGLGRGDVERLRDEVRARLARALEELERR
jgi:1-acyl-sn-glycerol-3-phosphate acyltransferase